MGLLQSLNRRQFVRGDTALYVNATYRPILFALEKKPCVLSDSCHFTRLSEIDAFVPIHEVFLSLSLFIVWSNISMSTMFPAGSDSFTLL